MNDIVRFVKGKKRGYIGYDSNGKIILSRNAVKCGYYKLSNIEEKEKVILADTERVPYDYFPDITYKEFLDVLKYNGFKIGFIEDFHYTCGNYIGDDHMIFAYDMKTHIIIVAESWNSGKYFNKIDVYCPGLGFLNAKNKLFSHGSCAMSIFNLVRHDITDKNIGVIHTIKDTMSDIIKDGKNIYKESISLWNYSEKRHDEEFFNKSRQKIKRADRKDMIELFKQSELMMVALNS